MLPGFGRDRHSRRPLLGYFQTSVRLQPNNLIRSTAFRSFTNITPFRLHEAGCRAVILYPIKFWFVSRRSMEGAALAVQRGVDAAQQRS